MGSKELKILLKNWEEATEALTFEFILKYFDEGADTYWIGDEIGGVLFVNDWFFNLDP